MSLCTLQLRLEVEQPFMPHWKGKGGFPCQNKKHHYIQVTCQSFWSICYSLATLCAAPWSLLLTGHQCAISLQVSTSLSLPHPVVWLQQSSVITFLASHKACWLLKTLWWFQGNVFAWEYCLFLKWQNVVLHLLWSHIVADPFMVVQHKHACW